MQIKIKITYCILFNTNAMLFNNDTIVGLHNNGTVYLSWEDYIITYRNKNKPINK